MRKVGVCLLLLGLLSMPLLAEDKVELFGGYQYLHVGDNSDFSNKGQGFNGWNIAGTVNASKHFGVEGDFSGTYATISGVKAHVYTYTGGPVVFGSTGKIKPFAHALFGGIKLSASESGVSVNFNGFTTMVGGGVDAKVNKAISIRVAQFDWLYYHFGSQTIAGMTIPSTSSGKNVRISTGIVLCF